MWERFTARLRLPQQGQCWMDAEPSQERAAGRGKGEKYVSTQCSGCRMHAPSMRSAEESEKQKTATRQNSTARSATDQPALVFCFPRACRFVARPNVPNFPGALRALLRLIWQSENAITKS